MAQKLFNTRIGLKYDTYANWSAMWTTYTPLKGEVVFFEVPAATGAVASEPAILFKVGDGSKNLQQLPWGSAIAADVYAWAKEQSLLGGQYNSGTGWDFSHATAIQQETQEEVKGLIKQETSNIKIKVAPVETPSGQTGDHWYQTYVSQDGGTTWEATGDPFQVQIDAYTAGLGLQLDNNEFSIIPAELSYESGSGLDVHEPNGVLTGSDVEEILKAAHDANEVTVEKLTTSEDGYASSYVVKQNGVKVGDTINIPKDYLVKSAELKTVTVADEPYASAVVGDKYIDFVVNTTDSSETAQHIYLPVKDLVDVYTGGDTDYISVSVDENNEITATLKDTMIADAISSGTGEDLLPTVDAVRDYVQDQIDNATPNIEAGDAISIDTTGNTKTVNVVLDETTQTTGLTQSSGLAITNDGLRIDDTVVWQFNCGDASHLNNQ